MQSERDSEKMLSQVLADLRLYVELNLISVTSGVHVPAESSQLRDSIAGALNNHPLELHAVDVGLYLGLRRPAAEVENLLQAFADMKAYSLRLRSFSVGWAATTNNA